MSLRSAATRSQLLDWSLTVGGLLGLVAGGLVFLQSHQDPISRSFVGLASISLTAMGIGNLLEARQPLVARRCIFVAKVFVGFALYSLSWGLSHR